MTAINEQYKIYQPLFQKFRMECEVIKTNKQKVYVKFYIQLMQNIFYTTSCMISFGPEITFFIHSLMNENSATLTTTRANNLVVALTIQ